MKDKIVNEPLDGPLELLERVADSKADLSRSHKMVAEYLQKSPETFLRASIKEIAKLASVSEPTLIRFCRKFGYDGLSDFRLALAMSVGARNDRNLINSEPSLQARFERNVAEKTRVAQAAARFLETDKSIALDSGSTSTLFADHLVNAPPLSIMTTSISSLLKLRNCRQHQLVLPGGTFRPDAMAVGGRMAEDALKNFTFDTAYIGADSIHPRNGLSTFDEAEAHLTEAIVNASNRVIVLADSSKFRVPALRRICDLSQVDVLITDEGIPAEDEQMLHERRVEVVKAGPDKAAG